MIQITFKFEVKQLVLFTLLVYALHFLIEFGSFYFVLGDLIVDLVFFLA